MVGGVNEKKSHNKVCTTRTLLNIILWDNMADKLN